MVGVGFTRTDTVVQLAVNGVLLVMGAYLIVNGAHLVWIPEQRTGRKVADSCHPGRTSTSCLEVYQLEDGELTSVPVTVAVDQSGTPDGVTRVVPDNSAPFATAMVTKMYRNKKVMGTALIIVGITVLFGPISVFWMRYHHKRR
jgi:hypothetical protein